MKRAWVIVAAGMVLTAGLRLGWADTLVLHDGRKLNGEVRRTESGYVVKMKAGSIAVESAEVADWIKAPAAEAPAPGTAPEKPQTPIAASAPTTAGGEPAKSLSKADSQSLATLLKAAEDALAAGEYKAAKESFRDVLVIDRSNVRALNGAAVAYLKLGDPDRAKDYLERACANPLADRAAIINMAALQIAQKSPMRGARLIVTYLTAHPEPPDEPMLNALGSCLYMADEQSRKQSFFREADGFYVKVNAKMEAARPGYKRWGAQWLDASEAEGKMTDWRRKIKDLDRMEGELHDFEARSLAARKELDKQTDWFMKGQNYRWNVERAQENYDEAERKRKDKQRSLEDVRDAMTKPQFPTEIATVPVDQAVAPGFSPVIVAMDTHKHSDDSESTTKPTDRPKIAMGDGPKHNPDDPPAQPRPHPADENPRPKPNDGDRPKPPVAVDERPKPPVAVKKVRITQYAAAFPVTKDMVVTSAATVAGAAEVEVQSLDGVSIKATVLRSDEKLGLALLKIEKKMFPLALAPSFGGGAVQCASLPRVNLFQPTAELIPGSAAKPTDTWTVKLTAHPRLAGAPLVVNGKVVGIELATRESEISQVPAVNVEQVRKFLGEEFVPPTEVGNDACAALLQVIATRVSN